MGKIFPVMFNLRFIRHLNLFIQLKPTCVRLGNYGDGGLYRGISEHNVPQFPRGDRY